MADDLFGNPIATVNPDGPARRRKRAPETPKGYAALPGTGPVTVTGIVAANKMERPVHAGGAILPPGLAPWRRVAPAAGQFRRHLQI